MDIYDIINWLNEFADQDSDLCYKKDSGEFPSHRFNPSTLVTLWECGAVAIIDNIIYFISEDDGYWFAKETSPEFHINWSKNFIACLNKAVEEYKSLQNGN